ncbi:hypothetical protein SO802_025042 [Lithocarpus litseifolius]|uniref:Uncharacterized protein n=1 Tax=Lithocarpus litseifolius TaxID=425828 RepID=A0AAW2BW30_9ROSI
MESAKLRAQIRAAAACKKDEGKGKEGVSSSLPKVIIKGTSKRKGDGMEDCLSKKRTVTPGEHPTKPSSPKHGDGKRLMSAHGLVSQEVERRLLTHKGYSLEMLESIFREKDADPCVNQSVGELGDSGLFDLARAMVHMKAMQVKGAKSEVLLARQQKRIKNLTDGLEQYKDACRTLNGEVKELKGKLEEEGRQVEKEREARVTAEKELTALLSQVETAKADAVTEFKASQSFVDSCAVYYGDGFEDFLKQVKFVYPYLDLSKVSIDDPLPSTLVGETTFGEGDDHSEPEVNSKSDCIVLAQPAVDKPVAPVIPSTNPLSFEGFSTPEARDTSKGDEVAQDPPVS